MLKRRPKVLLIVAILWIAVVGSGFLLLDDYSARPAAAASAPVRWPLDSRVPRVNGTATLLTFIHPHCPCSEASIDQLRRIIDRATDPVSCHVLFVAPAGAPAGWDQTSLRRSAATIPGVTVDLDIDRAEAQRFGALSSGHTLLYDVAGHLAFAGGLTSGRGHQGANSASDTVLSLLSDGPAEMRSTPVFGCPLSSQPLDDER